MYQRAVLSPERSAVGQSFRWHHVVGREVRRDASCRGVHEDVYCCGFDADEHARATLKKLLCLNTIVSKLRANREEFVSLTDSDRWNYFGADLFVFRILLRLIYGDSLLLDLRVPSLCSL